MFLKNTSAKTIWKLKNKNFSHRLNTFKVNTKQLFQRRILLIKQFEPLPRRTAVCPWEILGGRSEGCRIPSCWSCTLLIAPTLARMLKFLSREWSLLCTSKILNAITYYTRGVLKKYLFLVVTFNMKTLHTVVFTNKLFLLNRNHF